MSDVSADGDANSDLTAPFDYRAGVSRMTHKFQAIRGLPLGTLLAAETGLPISFLNDADAFGLGVFSTFLGQGGTPEQVAAAITGSPEYAQLHGATDAGFLAGLYQDALGRTPDPTGQAVFGSANDRSDCVRPICAVSM